MLGDIGPHTRRLLSYHELCDALHMSRTHLYRLEQDGLRLSADALVLPNSRAWDKERALEFGRDTGRLDKDNQPVATWHPDSSHLPRGANGKWKSLGNEQRNRELVVRKYSGGTRVYLGTWHCSMVYGLKNPAVYHLRRRGGFIKADVKVGEVFGWQEDRVIKFGRQTGRLDTAKLVSWALRRTELLALDPDVPWVRKLVDDGHLAKLPETPEPLRAA